MTLGQLHTGKSARVLNVGGEGYLRRHFLDMGIIPGTELKLLKRAPMGDPVEIFLRGYSLTLRLSEAAWIDVEEIEASAKPAQSTADKDFSYNLSLHEHNAHPGFGEEGKYHSKENERPLPKGTVINMALVGQHNCGKTSLFNQLTGSSQRVGNFPGVTTERKEAPVKGLPDTVVSDLPGIYSLSVYTEEERLTRDFILGQKPQVIVNVVDAGNIERNLYLTVQLMELGIPMVLAINMMDELRANGGVLRLNEMERELGLPVVPIAASRGEGLQELVEHAVHTAKYQEVPQRHDFCPADEEGGAVHRCLHSIMHSIEDHCIAAGLPVRFAASRIVEGDTEIIGKLHLSDNEKQALEHIIIQMEDERGLDRHSAMADMRYSFVHRLCRNTVKRPDESREFRRSRSIDRLLTGRWTAIPAFIVIMGLVFFLTFDVIGGFFQNLISEAFASLGVSVDSWFSRLEVAPELRSLVSDAIFGGVGTVLGFVPIMLVLFFFLSILEDSGYMARIAFVSDTLLRKIGLSGRSIVPMLIGFGCTVPAVMASRTLPSSHDRRLTVMMLPFMSCSAKIAVYGFIISAFFPGRAGSVMTGLYLLGIAVGIMVAVVSKLLRRETSAAPFVMELPVYRLPKLKNVGHLIWDKTKDFIQNAFTVIFIATIVIWFLQSFNFKLEFVSADRSMLADIAGHIAPVFAPLGLGDWRIATSLISGFIAKESIVSTLQVLGAGNLLTAATAVPMLVFCLLYTPCVASIAAVKRELGATWSVLMIVFQCVLAWIVAYVSYLIVLL